MLTVDSTMDVVKQVLEGSKCSGAVMPRAVWEEIEGQVKRLLPCYCRMCPPVPVLLVQHLYKCNHGITKCDTLLLERKYQV